MSITPNPFLNDDKKRLEEERKRDEEIFLERTRVQEKQQKELHERTVKGEISDLERTLDKQNMELRAIHAETPSLESRIRAAKREETDSNEGSEDREKDAIQDTKEHIDHLKESERNLEHELEETKRKEREAEDLLKTHERKLNDVTREHERAQDEARRDEETAHRRLEDKKHEAGKLETEIHRTESEIASLKREIQ